MYHGGQLSPHCTQRLRFRVPGFGFLVSGPGSRIRDWEVRVGEREVVGELAGGGQRPGAVEPRGARRLHLDARFGYQTFAYQTEFRFSGVGI